MAPIKRKTASQSQSTQPTKKQKPSPAGPSSASIRQEEPSFPRGGASILTPLEHKQIQIQAKNDVLFEQETGKKALKHDFGDEENEPDDFSDTDRPLPKASKRPNPKTKHSKAKPESRDEKGVRIEGLSYKRLVPGSMVLGQVSQINRYDVALSLPNNLTGYLPITSVSDFLTAKVERLAEDKETDDATQEQDISLGSYVFVGQYLRAYVVSTERESAAGTKGKRHIELSVNPKQANSSLKKSDLVVNSTIQASVRSVEDHGLIMDLGIEGDAVRGFMSSKEIGKNTDTSCIPKGAVFLCLITGLGSNGNVVKLSADTDKLGNLKKGHFLTDAPTIDCFLPGTAVEVLLSDITKSGMIGSAMGVLDVTVDLIHSGAAASGKALDTKYHVGDKIKGRIICTFPEVEPRKIGLSLLEHVISFKSNSTSSKLVADNTSPTTVLPLSTIVPEARVARVEPGVGLLVDMGVKGTRGFVHISRIADGKIENFTQDTGPYKAGTVHKARVIGYNSMDGLFIVSLEPKILAQPFLSIDDVQVGQIVKGTVEKLLLKESGVSGIIVSLAEGITGLVPEIHFSDIHLQHPERKFKEGASVTARVLSTSPAERQLRLTLKKTLVNSDEVWKSYDGLKIGDEAPGTIVKILSSSGAGAVVQFYGPVRGFLPVSEMSESYIEDPKNHFRVGQVVKVRLVSVDPTEHRMIVSCKDPSIFGAMQQEQLDSLTIGFMASGTVSQKTNDEIVVELTGSKVKANLPIEHLTDGSAQKSTAAAKKIRVGQDMTDLLILNKAVGRGSIQLTCKPSLVKAAQTNKLVKQFEDLHEGLEVDGFVNNSTSAGVFVEFANGVSGLLPKSQLTEEALLLPSYGMRKHQSISARILLVDHPRNRFSLTMKTTAPSKAAKLVNAPSVLDGALSNPVDEVSTNISDYSVGKLTKARVTSIKETQLNVHLADGIQGRIDASELFDRLEDIHDRKHPLKQFHSRQIVPVRILGMHDSRNHRFLPITHRSKAPVFELTAKPSSVASTGLDILTLEKVSVDSTYLVHVNNIAEDCVWVNLSPNVRGRIKALDLSDDVSLLKHLGKNFPVGSALSAKVVNVDVASSRLDLSSRSNTSAKPLAFSDLCVGMVLPGRVTRVNERQIMVQLTDSLSGPVNLVDLADDYSVANPTTFEKHQIVRVCIRGVDGANKRIHLSTRPSKTLSSSLPVQDREINAVSDLNINDVVRGFVKNVDDSGLFVSLAFDVTAFVRVSDLFDLFLKDWKSEFEIDQLVQGKIIKVDKDLDRVQMSLKRSHIDKNYQPPLTFDDMIVGQVVTGKVRKVESFGVFIVLDNSANVSGLCHISQMADRKSADPKKLYDEGDSVKAKILKIDRNTRRISLGLKASFFENEINADESDNELVERAIVEDDPSEDSEVDKIKAILAGNADQESEGWEGLEDANDSGTDTDKVNPDDGDGYGKAHRDQDSNLQGLAAGGFDWTGDISKATDGASSSDTDAEVSQPKKKKRRKAEPQVDLTGSLDAPGPQSVADFERLLLGRPNESGLWVRYMAFQLELSEMDKAREIAERALRTIHIREQDDKLNMWMALLNLENTYGTDESLDDVFARACQYCDSLDIHERLASTLIQSGKYEKAEAIYTKALSKHGSASDAVWLNVATFFLTTLDQAPKAHALLARALQSLPPHNHLQLTSQFAALEFKSPNGDAERGRTMFEGILGSFAKRLDIWSILIDLETNKGDKDRARGLFERVTRVKGIKAGKMKKWFEKWEKWEKVNGDVKSQGKANKVAEAYVRKVAEEKGMKGS
ncbi:MAG: hypothetical protein Q9168_005315 [Polycauliona sp. 1 TL-2023]